MALRFFFNGMFACVHSLAHRDRAAYRWEGSGAGRLHSFCLLTADDRLWPKVACTRSCGCACLRRPGFRYSCESGGGRACLFALWVLTSAAGLLTHYFFLFPWVAIVGYLMVRPGKLRRRQLALGVLATALLICLVRKAAGKSCRLADHEGLAEMAAAEFQSINGVAR